MVDTSGAGYTARGVAEHEVTANAKRVALLATDDGGATWRYVNVDSNGNLQVDVVSGGGGGAAEQAEDGAHTTGDVGNFVLGVRRDADTTPVDTDGDYHALIFDDAGNLKVNVKTSALPTGASTAAAQATGNSHLNNIVTAVQIMDDWDESDRAKVNLIASQAGIDGDEGTLTAKTVRTVHGSDEAIYPTPGSVAFSSLGTSFTSLLSISAECTEIHVYNGTNAVLKLSFDGGTTHHAYIAPYESRSWSYRAMNRKESSSVSVAEITAGDAVLGAVYADAVQ